MIQPQAMLSAIVLLYSTSVLARESRRSFSVCSFHSDCPTNDIWSIPFCTSGACQNTCKTGCKSTSSGCAPTMPVGSCAQGQSWNPVSRSCISTVSDPHNCGGYQNVCPTDSMGTAVCSNSSCSIRCNDQTILGSSGSCIPNTQSACGAQGKACSNPLSNGVAVCNLGVCSQACNSGYVYNSATNDCVINNSVNSCGIFNTRCPVYTGTTATCNLGVCGVTCNNGGVFNPLSNSCTSTAATCGVFPFAQKCPQVANGRSVCNVLNCLTVCNDGYVLSSSLSQDIFSLIGLSPSSTTCVSITNNNNVCGTSKTRCATSKPNCISTCTNGACVLSGASGYSYSSASDSCVATSSDVNNCGAPGYACFSPANGSASCKNGACTFSCNTGFQQSGHTCKAANASPVPVNKKKRGGPVEAFYCPTGETACPVEGSQSLAAARAAAAKTGSLQFSVGEKGGYECIDTQVTLESCGGCASLGEGQDCSRLPHASSMGCNNGKCQIFQCQAGFVANAKGSKCVRLSHRHHNATTARHQSRHSNVHDMTSF